MFGAIRTTTNERGEPLFVGKDVAEALGYSNTRDALRKHVDSEDKDAVAIRDSIGRDQQTIFITDRPVAIQLNIFVENGSKGNLELRIKN